MSVSAQILLQRTGAALAVPVCFGLVFAYLWYHPLTLLGLPILGFIVPMMMGFVAGSFLKWSLLPFGICVGLFFLLVCIAGYFDDLWVAVSIARVGVVGAILVCMGFAFAGQWQRYYCSLVIATHLGALCWTLAWMWAVISC